MVPILGSKNKERILAGCGSSEGVSGEPASQTQTAQEQETVNDEEQTAATVTEDTTSETEEGEISSTSDSAESDDPYEKMVLLCKPILIKKEAKIEAGAKRLE